MMAEFTVCAMAYSAISLQSQNCCQIACGDTDTEKPLHVVFYGIMGQRPECSPIGSRLLEFSMCNSPIPTLFARPGKMPAEPYFELPILLSKLKRLMQFRLGSHDLPIEQGRMARPIVPRYLRRCTLCSRHAPGDERHFMLECPQFDDIRAQYPDLLQDARDSMCNLMWHQRPEGPV